jgi:meso-butanediol dehydrogenase / (S,S)-butanediol dehydrogenase / diacetyl reductase
MENWGFGPRMRDKVALISGIGSGQGRAAALLFSRHGAKVVGCDLNRERAEEVAAEAQRHGGEVLALEANAVDEGDVARWVGAAVSHFGRVDVLYNNAALGGFGMVHEMPLAEWRRAIQGELDVVFLGCKHAIPHMTAGGGGSVINTGSVSGLVSTELPGMPGGMAHAAAKAGVVGMTRSLAQEYAAQGIRVNCICPGSIETPSMKLGGFDTPAFREAILAKVLIKRLGRPEDIAFCALYLASDESSYVTGATFVVDGGWTAV